MADVEAIGTQLVQLLVLMLPSMLRLGLLPMAQLLVLILVPAPVLALVLVPERIPWLLVMCATVIEEIALS